MLVGDQARPVPPACLAGACAGLKLFHRPPPSIGRVHHCTLMLFGDMSFTAIARHCSWHLSENVVLHMTPICSLDLSVCLSTRQSATRISSEVSPTVGVMKSPWEAGHTHWVLTRVTKLEMDNMYRRRRYLQGLVRRAFSRGCCCALTPNNQRCL